MEKSEKLLFELRPQMAVAIIPIIIGALITSTIFGVGVGLFTRQLVYGLLVFFMIGFFSIFFRLMNLRARRYLFYENKAEFHSYSALFSLSASQRFRYQSPGLPRPLVCVFGG